MSGNSASTQTQAILVSPISREQPIDFTVNYTKDEQINSLNAEVQALKKSFITEQLYIINSIEHFKYQKNIPNSSVLIQSLNDKLSYLRNENLAKTSIIKLLTENHFVPANINLIVFPPEVHHEKVQDEKHKSSTNKSFDSSKTDGKSIYLKSKEN